MTTKDQAIALDLERIARARYTPVHTGFWWKVKIGDGDQAVGKEHTEANAQRLAAQFTRAFLDGAFLQAQAQPPAPDCRTCEHMNFCYAYTPYAACTNGDQYQPAPKVVLWRTV